MKTLLLKRTYFNDATIGLLWIEGQDNPVWHTIEKPWLDNMAFKSCIPEGEYVVKSYTSQKYPDVWEITSVQDRTHILIHAGNWESDLQGCIAVGVSAGYMQQASESKKAVTSSRIAINQLKKVIGYPSEFKLKITG